MVVGVVEPDDLTTTADGEHVLRGVLVLRVERELGSRAAEQLARAIVSPVVLLGAERGAADQDRSQGDGPPHHHTPSISLQRPFASSPRSTRHVLSAKSEGMHL